MQKNNASKTPMRNLLLVPNLYYIMYLLGVVHHGKGSKRVKDDIHNYTWMEQEKEKTVV